MQLTRSKSGILILLMCIPVCITLTKRGFYIDDHFFLMRAEKMSVAESIQDNIEIYGGLRILGYGLMSLQYGLLKDNPIAHHSLTVLLLFITAVALFYFLQTLVGDRSLALLGAVSFVVVPWHSQAIFWVISTHVQLSAIFLIISGYLFLRHLQNPDKKVFLTASVIGYVISILFYEQSLSWIFIWPLLVFVVDQNAKLLEVAKKSLPHIIGAIVLAAIITAYSAESERQSNPELKVASILVQFPELLRYAVKYHIYHSITGIRSYHIPVLNQWWVYSSWYFIPLFIFASTAIVIGIKTGYSNLISDTKGKGILVILGVLMVLCPIGILSLTQNPVIEQRTMYIVSIGLVLLLILFFASMSSWIRTKTMSSLPRAVIIVASLVVLGITTATRSEEWVTAWNMQLSVSNQLRDHLPNPPSDAVIIIMDFPESVGFSSKTYGNEHGLFNLVRRIYSREDIRGHSSLHYGRMGDLIAGKPENLSTEVENRSLFIFKYIREEDRLIEQKLSEIKARFHQGD